MRTGTAVGRLAMLALCAMPRVAAGEEADVRLIAVDGMPIAGSTEHMVFSRDAGPASVNRDGHVAFLFRLGDEATASEPALWMYAGGEHLLLTAPARSESDALSDFDATFARTQLDDFALTDDDMIVFLTGHEDRQGFWAMQVQSTVAATVEPIAVVGDPAPAGGTWQGVAEGLGGPGDIAFRVSSRGSVLFRARDESGSGLYLRRLGEITPIVTESSPVPGFPGRFFDELSSASFYLTDEDEVILYTSARDPAREVGTPGIWSAVGGALTLAVTAVPEADAVAGDITALQGLEAASPNGHVAFLTNRRDDSPSGGYWTVPTVFLLPPGGAPAILIDHETWPAVDFVSWILDLAVSDAGHVAAIARVIALGGGDEVSSLVLARGPGEYELVGMGGNDAPGGGVFHEFQELAFDSNGDLVFTAEMAPAASGGRGGYRYRDGSVEPILPAGTVLTDPSGGEHVVHLAFHHGRNPHNRVTGGGGEVCYGVIFDAGDGGIACSGLPAPDPLPELVISARAEVQPPPSFGRAFAGTRQPDFIYIGSLECPTDELDGWRMSVTFREPVVPVEIEPTIPETELISSLCDFVIDPFGLATAYECEAPEGGGFELRMGVQQPFEIGVAVAPAGYADHELHARFDATAPHSSGRAVVADPVDVVETAYVADLEVLVESTDPLTLLARSNGPDDPGRVDPGLSSYPWLYVTDMGGGADEDLECEYLSSWNEGYPHSWMARCRVSPALEGIRFRMSARGVEAYIAWDDSDPRWRDPDESNNYLSVDGDGNPAPTAGRGTCGGASCSATQPGGDPAAVAFALVALRLLIRRRLR